VRGHYPGNKDVLDNARERAAEVMRNKVPERRAARADRLAEAQAVHARQAIQWARHVRRSRVSSLAYPPSREAFDRVALRELGLAPSEVDATVARLERLETLVACARTCRDLAEDRGDWTTASRASRVASRWLAAVDAVFDLAEERGARGAS
jgi:hypothetical protein